MRERPGLAEAANSSVRSQVCSARLVVVKVGSSSLTGADGGLALPALRALVDALATHVATGHQVVLVTSGAVAAGLAPLRLTQRPGDVPTAQAAASVGQGVLIARYTEAFGAHGLNVGQVLLTADDAVRRERYENARQTLRRLLSLGVVPVINENDAVTTDELKFGDNDRLAALVAQLVGADLLVLLTDVDGLHTKSPRHRDAERIAYVAHLQDVAHVPVSAHGSHLGTGGMVTKLEAVRIATGAGIPVVLTAAHLVSAALAGGDVGTFFAAGSGRLTARRLWLAHAARSRGTLGLDEGAVAALLEQGASLLPAGIVEIEGEFEAGDAVELVGPRPGGDQAVVARGIVAYDSRDLPRLIGRHTSWLARALGPQFAKPVVHRDDLVLGASERNS